MQRESSLFFRLIFFLVLSLLLYYFFFFFFFNDTATTEIYTLSLHDALPISRPRCARRDRRGRRPAHRCLAGGGSGAGTRQRRVRCPAPWRRRPLPSGARTAAAPAVSGPAAHAGPSPAGGPRRCPRFPGAGRAGPGAWETGLP